MASSNVPSEPALTIASLIDRRCRELQLRPAELVRRAGYRNISKGLRRLDQLCDGDFHLARELIRGLPHALEVPEPVVRSAIARDIEALANAERQAAAEREAAWRAALRPHAIAVTARRVPSPIFAAAVSNATRSMRTELDATADPATFFDQAVRGLRRLLAERGWDTPAPGGYPGFGRLTGVVVNDTPDHAIRYDLDGRVLEVLPHADRLGEIQLRSGRRRFPPELFSPVEPASPDCGFRSS
jgi:hypothetical protein